MTTIFKIRGLIFGKPFSALFKTIILQEAALVRVPMRPVSIHHEESEQ